MQDVAGWSFSSWDSCYRDTQFCSYFLLKYFPLLIYLYNSAVYPTVYPTVYSTVYPTVYTTVYPTVYTTIENKWCERSKPSTESWMFGAFELLTLKFNFNYDFVIFFCPFMLLQFYLYLYVLFRWNSEKRKKVRQMNMRSQSSREINNCLYIFLSCNFCLMIMKRLRTFPLIQRTLGKVSKIHAR